ncbi:alpha/beta fold hydrolase [Paraconexibacter sp.]|uniref:alpha/beta fold hydrolase n=1 Tax=Paraconexibacter sp. TaxID=2949640 RepID=UPI003568D105
MPEITPALYRAGHGEPVVLLHGFTGTWHHWRPVLADLVGRYEVIAPTLAGHAGGPLFEADDLSLEAAADHLAGHLDDLGVQSAHLVGNSMGGALAIELAKRGRARSVVALAPGGGWEPGHAESQRLARFFTRTIKLSRAAAPRAPKLLARPGARKLAFRDIMRHGELVQPADAVDLVRESLQCAVSERVISALEAGTPVLSGLDAVRAPVLLAWPQYDRILPMPLHSPRLRREIPGNEFRVLPGCGHVPMWDDPRLIVRTISEWVDRHATAEGQPTTLAASTA